MAVDPGVHIPAYHAQDCAVHLAFSDKVELLMGSGLRRVDRWSDDRYLICAKGNIAKVCRTSSVAGLFWSCMMIDEVNAAIIVKQP